MPKSPRVVFTVDKALRLLPPGVYEAAVDSLVIGETGRVELSCHITKPILLDSDVPKRRMGPRED